MMSEVGLDTDGIYAEEVDYPEVDGSEEDICFVLSSLVTLVEELYFLERPGVFLCQNTKRQINN